MTDSPLFLPSAAQDLRCLDVIGQDLLDLEGGHGHALHLLHISGGGVHHHHHLEDGGHFQGKNNDCKKGKQDILIFKV